MPEHQASKYEPLFSLLQEVRVPVETVMTVKLDKDVRLQPAR